MIRFLFVGGLRTRILAGTGVVLIMFQWWIVPNLPGDWTSKWLWSLDPVRNFPLWFRVTVSLAILFLPIDRLVAQLLRPFEQGWFTWLGIGIATLAGGFVFWTLRMGDLGLGDSIQIMDYFVALQTYVAGRQPLEAVLHTDIAKLLFDFLGVQPRTSFQLLSCFYGCLMLALAGWGLSGIKREGRCYLTWLGTLFLVGPIHLFFGYIEFYTQMALGLVLFQVFAIRQLLTGRGLWWALGGLTFACCSHFLAIGFLPAALILILFSRQPGKRIRSILGFAFLLVGSFGATSLWIMTNIKYDYHLKTAAGLLTTLMPFISEDDPNLPPGAWTYEWLSANHLSDLGNEILLCALFPILLLAAVDPCRFLLRELVNALCLLRPSKLRATPADIPIETRLAGFFLPQLVLCFVFVLVWNPWLGFPDDWDLFSFFAWPLLAVAVLVSAQQYDAPKRDHIISIAAYPAASIVFAWVLFYHSAPIPSVAEVRAWGNGTLAEYRMEQARAELSSHHWQGALQNAEQAIAKNPELRSEVFQLFDISTIHLMASEWPEPEDIPMLAIDFEVVAASPTVQALVLDRWGRVFLWENGTYSEWATEGLPDTPENLAVDMEMVPWLDSAVVLQEDGAVHQVDTQTAGQTLQPIGNLLLDSAGKPWHPGSRALDLVVDSQNKRLVVFDTVGELVSDGSKLDYGITRRESFIGVDAELSENGNSMLLQTYFGTVKAWPGGEVPLQAAMNFNWQACIDMELAAGHHDIYILDVQGGIHAFPSAGIPYIQPDELLHFSPEGNRLDHYPYVFIPQPLFKDLEILPGERTFYRMTRNFRIHRSGETP